MRIYLGSDHAGFELKGYLLAELAEHGYDPVDVGPSTFDPEDDYPEWCMRTGVLVVGEPGSLGVVIGGSGNGEQIAANKVPGVRAALAWDETTARLAREHNDANVVGIGARMHTRAEALSIVRSFVDTSFSGGARHVRRIGQIAAYEEGRTLPPLDD